MKIGLTLKTLAVLALVALSTAAIVDGEHLAAAPGATLAPHWQPQWQPYN